MIRLGLTGGIASGKTTVGRQFVRQGAAFFDADAAVHVLLRRGALQGRVAMRFPEAVCNGAIDRRALGAIVFADPEALGDLEAMLHPAVAAWEETLARRYAREGRRVMVSDIPLLFEVGAQSRYDATLLVSCPAFLQRRRALSRPGMNPEKYDRILSRQMPLAEKRKRADREIFTGLGRAASMAAVKKTLVIVGDW